MNPALLSLLQQSSIPQGNPLDPSLAQTAVPDVPIVVQGANTPSQGPAAMGEPYYAPEVDRLPPSNKAMQELIPHKGMFGLKGTLRDVIGAIGDSILLGTGHQEIYAPHRRREKLGDAMYGIDYNDPQAVQAGIDRLAAGGFAEEAQELQKQYAVTQYQQQQGARADARINQAAMREKMKLGSAMAEAAKGPEDMAIIKAWIKDPDAGIDSLPDHLLAASGMTPYQQGQLPLRERSVAAQERNAQSSAIRAARPPAARARPRSDSNLEYFQALKDVPPNERTADESAWLRDYLGQNKGASSRRAPPSGGIKPKAGGFKVISQRPKN